MGIDTQRAEFDAVADVAKAYRDIELTPIVDGDYPVVRHRYEGAIMRLVDACVQNGRPLLSAGEVVKVAIASTTRSILQDWVMTLGLRHQGVIVSAMRGCDSAERDDNSKQIQRLLRGAVLEPHCGRGVKPATYMMTEPDPTAWWTMCSRFLNSHDHYPNHYVLHFILAAEVIGYHGPLLDPVYSDRWKKLYLAFMHKFHVNPETKEQLDARLNADEESFKRLQNG